MSDIVQRSEDWFTKRLGFVGCSRLGDVMAKGRNGEPSATRRNYMGELLCERLTGKHADSFTTKEMQWGIDNEPRAKAEYEARECVMVIDHGGMEHKDIKWWWGSPDFLVGDNGGGEIKCLNTMNHLDVMMRGNIDRRYFLQITGYVEIFDREWWDYVGYDPRLPDNCCYFRKRFYRDDLPIAEVRESVIKFIDELNELENKVRAIK